MSKFKANFEIELSKAYSPSERKAIAAEIIDHIISRTENGVDKNGKKFTGYSDEYAKEKGQTKVDLTFSGDMLNSMQLLTDSSGKIKIGFPRDYENLGKVEGNVLGTYGDSKKPEEKRTPRDFLGLTDKELNTILKNYPVDDKEARQERISIVQTAGKIADEILKNVGFEDEGE